MTAFQVVREALLPFGLPVVPYLYEGTKKEYLVYNYANATGADFGDDRPLRTVAAVQVHYYVPITKASGGKNDFIEMRDRIRKALFDAGMTWPEVEVIREDEVNSWHLVFEGELEEEA